MPEQDAIRSNSFDDIEVDNQPFVKALIFENSYCVEPYVPIDTVRSLRSLCKENYLNPFFCVINPDSSLYCKMKSDDGVVSAVQTIAEAKAKTKSLLFLSAPLLMP